MWMQANEILLYPCKQRTQARATLCKHDHLAGLKSMTADSAQPTKHSVLFSSWEGGIWGQDKGMKSHKIQLFCRDGRYNTRIINTTYTNTYSIDTWFLATSILSSHDTFRHVVLSFVFWHCALISIFFGRGKEELVLFGIISYQYTMQIYSVSYWIISYWYRPPLLSWTKF